MAPSPAALRARRLLAGASRSLQTIDPVDQLGGFLDEALAHPPGHPAYRSGHAFEPAFTEQARGALSVSIGLDEDGPAGSGGVQAVTDQARRLVGANLGRGALSWLDQRLETANGPGRWPGHGRASLLGGFDRDGFREAQVTMLWGPWLTEALPSEAFRLAELVMDALPGLQPALTTIRAARSSGSQSLTFRMDGPLPLASLRPLLDRLGLAHQHASLTTAVAFVLGARYTLPPGSALVTIRPTPRGIELRLDVDLEAVPDLPPNVGELLGLTLADRPQSLHALERWVMALTPDGDDAPGALSVLSVTVRQDMGARLALHVRPSVLTDTVGPPSRPEGAVLATGAGVGDPWGTADPWEATPYATAGRR